MSLPVVHRVLSASLFMGAGTLLSTAAVAVIAPDTSLRPWLPTAIGLLAGSIAMVKNSQLPVGLKALLQGRRRLAALAALLAVLACAQVARQSAYVADSGLRWGQALPTDPGHHLCLAAYVRAAEINRDALAPLYESEAYEHDTTTASTIEGLRETLGDPFVYPPQALVLPRLGIHLTNRLSILHAVWVSMAALLFGWTALSVARHLQGDARWIALLLVPAVWLSLPVAYNTEYGQVHLLTIATAMAAMIAFQHKRDVLGGSLLAIAIGWKLFPGLLLVYLLVQRRWRAVLYTLGCSLALAAITLVLVGWSAYNEFFSEHLPSLLSGQAFDRYYTWGDVTAQMSLAGQANVLGLGASISKVVAGSYTAGALALTIWVAKNRPRSRPVVWLALLNLGAMQSPFAPASYLAAGIVWLLSLWVAENWQRPALVRVGVGAWLFVQTAPFLDVLPGLWSMRPLQLVSALIATAIAITFCLHSCVSPTQQGSLS